MVRDSVVVAADIVQHSSCSLSSLCGGTLPVTTTSSSLVDANNAPAVVVALHNLLQCADLLSYYDGLKNVLKLRHAGDLAYTDQEDLDGIGMSRPEQKRLFREYAKHFPMATSGRKGFVSKLKRKVFGGKGGGGAAEANHHQAQSTATATKNRKDGGNTSNTFMRFGMDEFRTSSATAAADDHQHIIPAERISICKQIGSGEFGCVFQAAWRKDKSGASGEVIQVAVKQILPEKLISQPSSFLQEAAIMTRMQHENVIRLFGVVLDTKVVMLVSELAPCGSLLECLQSTAWRDPFTVPCLCQFALQIARGMHYLSSQRLIHRDLAARNVLVSSPSKVKISDFGLSRSLGYSEDYYRSEFTPTMKLPIAWCAPECINFLRFTCASDVWAYGVCLWEMFSSGQTPWAGFTGSQILHAIDTQRHKLERPSLCPSGIYSLMLCCWEWEPVKRPSFEQICKRLPDAFPSELMTVAECRTKRDGLLQYGKGEIIVLLDKSTSQPGMWRGLISKSGKIGLFPPDDTIAHLGAENPSEQGDNIVSAIATQPAPMMTARNGRDENGEKKGKKKREKEKSENKNTKKEKNGGKLVISQPQGDLRHTCHMGADGRSFGLLNIDKNDLPRALPPRMPTTTTSPVAADMSLPSIMFASTISLAPPRPPKLHRTGMDAMSGSVCLENGAELAALSSSSTSPPPQRPVLPPKPPRFCARPYQQISSPLQSSEDSKNNGIAITTTNAEAGVSIGTSPFPLDEKEQQYQQAQSSPIAVNKRRNVEEKNGEEQEEEGEEEEQFLRPPSICLEQLTKKKKREMAENEKKEHDENGNDTEEKTNQREETGEEKADGEAVRKSLVIRMDANGFEKRAAMERRKADKELSRMQQQQEEHQQQKRRSSPSGFSGFGGTGACHQSPGTIKRLLMPKQQQQSTKKNGGIEDEKHGKATTNELPKSKKEPVEDWSPEADLAYKLLVQCGHLLKDTKTLEQDQTANCQQTMKIVDEKEAADGIRMPLPKVTQQFPLSISNPLNGSGKRPGLTTSLRPECWAQTARTEQWQSNESSGNSIEYINSQLLDNNNGDDGTTQQMNSSNKNGMIAKLSRSPPPVPPKPKLKFVGIVEGGEEMIIAFVFNIKNTIASIPG